MKITCRMLSILLLSTLSYVAAQRAGVPSSATADTPPIELFSFSVVQKPPQMAGATPGPASEDVAGYNSAVPLLSCIGAGMALGGLVSARWWESRDK